jgi:alkanesulfonate monooxygenase SsuD/methylene tetrahydromethanopterin reductase-like flavin-dependent oxidoreductase (luciferase family)
VTSARELWHNLAREAATLEALRSDQPQELPMPKRPIWTVIPPMPAAVFKLIVEQVDAQGLTGIFTTQFNNTPFVPLAAAAMVSDRLLLGTGIAISSTRSPYETALTAIDLDRISGGRFVLGLGASVPELTANAYGVAPRKPLTDLRETVLAIKRIVAHSHTGSVGKIEGEYYRADFNLPVGPGPTDPPVRENIPIWIAAMFEKAARLAGEVGDGVMGHPMWSPTWARERIRVDFQAGLDSAKRNRADVTAVLWPWAAPGADVRQAIEDAKGTLGVYASAPSYERFFEAHGFGEQARACQAAFMGGPSAAAKCVTEDMVRTFVAVGSDDEVRAHIERYWEVADALCIVPPVYGIPMERVFGYVGEIARVLYA